MRQPASLLLCCLLILITACAPQPAAVVPTRTLEAPTTAAATLTVTPGRPPVVTATPPAANETVAPPAPKATAAPTLPPEVAVTTIPIEGPVSGARAEVSGMAVFGDTAVLIPQYPARLDSHPGGALYAIPLTQIEAYLDGETTEPVTPQVVPFTSGGIERSIRGFEGFEAAAFTEDDVFLLIEAKQGGQMVSFLVRGDVEPDLSEIRIDASSLTAVPLDVQISNFSNEALVIHDDRLLLFYEANGALAYPEARALRYTFDLQPDGSIPLVNLEYRLTDATIPDEDGRFWVTNFFFPGDLKIAPPSDPVAEQFGKGLTHSAGSVVERLVELQLPEDEGVEITLSGRPPVQLALGDGLIPRNWEGIVRINGRGFLIVTDLFPQTILAFVPFPE